jgi:hypothetical protein
MACLLALLAFGQTDVEVNAGEGLPPLSLTREGHWLIISGPQVYGGSIKINYLEAYCRGDSATNDWVKHTIIPFKNEMLSPTNQHQEIRLRDTLADGVTVEHVITATADEVDFRLTAHNPTSLSSEVQWAQPCVRLGDFTGFGSAQTTNDYAYLPKCFVFLDGQLKRMPFEPWSTEARYVPGQVWRAPKVSAADVNPRPLSQRVPVHGLIGCYSGDDKRIFATAWEPYQELFQGVARCLHSDFRVGGLKPGETKHIQGKIYIVPADARALLERYRRDFPSQGNPLEK